ncbi:MAG TPA: regulatory protein RecX [Nevskiaceae bacterium]|nr:regulatory protein RecX [Nevskiaceae bacterium]
MRQNRRDLSQAAAARAFALRAVARRECSARELQRKLMDGGAPAAVAAAVVEDFTARGWQDDRRYAESLVRTRSARGYGPLRVRRDLEAAGVAAELIDAVLAVAPCQGSWRDLARHSCERHFRTPAATPAERQKRWQFLARRGYGSDDIRAVLGEQDP